MPMNVESGIVKRIVIMPEACCLTMIWEDDAPHLPQFILLWSYSSQEDSATNRLLHGTYLALARDAYEQKSPLQVAWFDNSSLVEWVALQ